MLGFTSAGRKDQRCFLESGGQRCVDRFCIFLNANYAGKEESSQITRWRAILAISKMFASENIAFGFFPISIKIRVKRESTPFFFFKQHSQAPRKSCILSTTRCFTSRRDTKRFFFSKHAASDWVLGAPEQRQRMFCMHEYSHCCPVNRGVCSDAVAMRRNLSLIN